MSSNYTVTRDQIISQALRKCGVLELGDTPDAASIANAGIALNLLIKQLSTEGLKLWKVSELIIPLVANTTKYILGGASSVTMYDSLAPSTAITDKPLKVIQGWYRNTQSTPDIDTPVLLVSKQEYSLLGSKFSTGSSNTVFYDVKTTYGVLYVYLTPDTSTATNTQLHLIAQMQLKDITTALDTPDFPNEWMNCLIWNLADQLALEYGVPMNARQEIATRSRLYREDMSNWDVEAYSTFFSPDFRSTSTNAYS